MEQEKLELKNRSQQVNQKKTPVLLGVLEVWGYILISRPNSKKKAFYTKPTPLLKSSDALKLFGFLYRLEQATYFMTTNIITMRL